MISELINAVNTVKRICEGTNSQLLSFDMDDEGVGSEVTIRLLISPSNSKLTITEESNLAKLREIEEIVK